MRKVNIAAIFVALFFSCAVNATPVLYATAHSDADLRVLNQATGGVVSSVTMTLAGETIAGTNALAWDAGSNQLFGMLKLSGQSSRELVTIDQLTGVATSIGDTGVSGAGLRFAGLDFDGAGTLYGVTGDGSSISPETLRTLNVATAASALFLGLGNGNDGETIAYNYDDGLMYHLSGYPSPAVVFESIDLVASTTSNIFTGSGNIAFDEGRAFTYAGSNNFFASGGSRDLWGLTSAGVLTKIGPSGFAITGLAITRDVEQVPAPATLALFGLGLAGLGWSRRKKA